MTSTDTQTTTTPTKNPAAVELGRKGGAARNPRKGFGSLTPEQRRVAQEKAVAARKANREKAG